MLFGHYPSIQLELTLVNYVDMTKFATLVVNHLVVINFEVFKVVDESFNGISIDQTKKLYFLQKLIFLFAL